MAFVTDTLAPALDRIPDRDLGHILGPALDRILDRDLGHIPYPGLITPPMVVAGGRIIVLVGSRIMALIGAV
jgi:hypothetical protein